MPLPITIPNTFANATATIPLSQLDNNFATVEVAVNSIGNGAFTLANVQVTGGTIANVTLDNVSVDVETLSNVTITNLTVNGNATFTNAAVTANVATITTANVTTANVTNLVTGNATITGGTINVASVIATDDVTVGDDLIFTGTGNRITGDFSNATLANRVAFQTSTTNSNTALVTIPNGTASFSGWQFTNNSVPDNAAYLQVGASSTAAGIVSGIFGTGTYLPMTFFTGGSECMRIDTSGNVLFATSTTRSNFNSGTQTPAFQIEKAADVRSSITRDTNDSGAPLHIFAKSRGTTVNSNTIVQSGDGLGIIDFQGADGTNLIRAATIRAIVDGTPGTNDMPGALVFSTTADGGSDVTERMRIDSSGNVGIGQSYGLANSKLVVAGQAAQADGAYATGRGSIVLNEALRNSINDTGGFEFKTSTFGSGYGAKIMALDNGTLVFGNRDNSATYTERMRIDSSGNVGIGTSSPSFVSGYGGLQINGGGNGSVLHLTNSTTGTTSTDGFDLIVLQGGSDAYVWQRENAPLIFGTNNTERARITSGGEVYIAGTTDQGAYNLQCNGTGVWGAGAYVNGSDERIKEDIAPLTSGLDVVAKLNPVTYRYKESWSKDQSIQPGFIAQEMLVAMEGQDYVDGVVSQGGSEGYYSVAYQNIIPLLTKAIQELKAELDATKAEVAALKGA